MGSAGSPIAIGNLYGSGTAPIVGFGSPAQLPIGSALINPISVAFDGSGDVFVATPASSAVYEVVAAGGVVSSSSVVRTVGSGFAVPYGLAVDGSGNVFVADTGDQTVKEIVAVNGAVSSASTVSILNSSFGAPTGVAVDKSGNVFVADTSGAGAVSEIVATNGVVSSNSFVKTVGSGFSSPRHVAVDGSGNVYVADFGNNAVKEILAINGVVSSISTVTNIGSGFSTPNDVAVAPNGSIVVADLGNNAVKEILAINGAVSPSSVVQALASGLTSPEGLAVDGSGNVIVAETDLDQVIELNVVTPPTLSFATTVVGATSTDSPQTVTITNQGNAALTFEIPTTGQNPSISANFTLDNSSTCPQLSPVSSTATLAVGSSCTEVLNFTPTIPGSISGALAIVDNSLNAAAPAYSLQTIALSGTGVLSPPAKVATSVIPSTVVSGGNLGILTATIEDANANIISASSALVTMMITGPGGYSQTVTGTAVNGVAIFDLSSLILSAAGPYTVTTSSQGLTGTSSPVTARVGAPVAVLTNNLPATVVSGANLGTAISVIKDINGNTVTSSSAAVTTTITGPGGYSQSITRNAINGIATFDLNSLILTTAGSYTVTTTSPGLTGGSSPSTVTVGAAAKIATNNIPATIVSGGNLGIVTATIKDTNGNTVTTSSAFVTGIIAGPGGYSQTVTGTTVNGVATYDLSSPVLTVAGSYTITTNSPGLTGASSATMVTPGAPASVTSSNIPSTVVSGGNLGIVTAAIKDASGNTVTTSSAVVTGTLTGPGGYSQTVTGTAVNGIVTYDLSSLTLVTMGTYTLTSSSPGLTGATSATAVTPGAAAQVTTSNIPSTVVSGGNLGIVTATIKDANGNTVTSSSAIVTAIITGPGGYSQTLTGTAVNGVVSFDLSSLSLTQAGGYTVMTSSPGLSGTVSTATVLVGPAAKITTSNIPSIVVSGGNLGTFTATIKDANGTTVTGSPAMVTATIAGPGGYSHTVTGTAVNGVASFDLSSLSLILPGSYTITTSSPGLTGTSSAATVTVGTAATIATSNIPSTVASGGNAGIITATIKDANGNTVTKSSAVITATITGPGGYSQTVPGTAIDGVATFDLTSLHLTTSGGYTVTISSPGLTGTSAALTVPLAPDFGIAATSGSPTASLVPGAAANYTLTITPDSSGFANVISLSAMGLPSGSTYSFSPSSLTPGSTAANTVLNVQTSSTLAMIHVLGGSIGLTMALLVIPFRLPRKVRQRLRSTWLFRAAAALILLGGFAALTGCGSTNGFFGESAHSYIVTVTATSGSLSHSTTVVLNLQ